MNKIPVMPRIGVKNRPKLGARVLMCTAVNVDRMRGHVS